MGNDRKYDVAAYIWPSYTGDEKRSRIFWEEGFGEWQTVKKSCGGQPLWGYVNEADPYVMQMQIDAALEHGVNVFIYDWYWYDDRPFLENCLNDGFLRAKNNKQMKFYLMWANHDATDVWDKRNAGNDTVVWSGRITFEQLKKIAKRWLDKYMCLENYYKLDNKPVLSIYDLSNFVNGLGGLENAQKAMEYMNGLAREKGFDGIHFQLIKYGENMLNLSGVDSEGADIMPEQAAKLGFSSSTHYQYIHFTEFEKDYENLLEDVKAEWNAAQKLGMTYFPHVSIGWDNTPRYNEIRLPQAKNNSPEIFKKHLKAAKDLADKSGVNLITINSWNEWTETSYLEPDTKYGYGYLQAVKEIFGGADE